MPFLISRPTPAGKLLGENTVFQSLKEVLPVHIINENVLSAVPTIHHVIDRARIFHSHGASVSGYTPVKQGRHRKQAQTASLRRICRDQSTV